MAGLADGNFDELDSDSAESAADFCFQHDDDDDEHQPNCWDRMRARRVYWGLRLFGLVPDPLMHLRLVGIDCSSFYRRCGQRCCCAGLFLTLVTCMYITLEFNKLFGYAPILVYVPVALVLFAFGLYLVCLACSTRTGIHAIMHALGPTKQDLHRPVRVRTAYKRLSDLDTDIQVLDGHSATAVRQLLQHKDEVLRDALERGFNKDFLSTITGDDESQRFLLAACLMTADDAAKLNEHLRVYTIDGQTKVCGLRDVPEGMEPYSVDEMLRQSGFKEEIGLSMCLLSRCAGRAVLLRWAMGHSYAAKIGLNLTWIQQGLGKALNSVDELTVARLLLVPPRSELRETIQEYDKLAGASGKFREHISGQPMNADFRVALLALCDSSLRDQPYTADAFAQQVHLAVTRRDTKLTIQLLCLADPETVVELPQEVKEQISVYFGSTQAAQPPGSWQSVQSSKASVLGRPSSIDSGCKLFVWPGPSGRMPYWLNACTAPRSVVGRYCSNELAERFEVVLEPLETAAKKVKEAAKDAADDLADLIMGPSTDRLIHLLLNSRSITQAGQLNAFFFLEVKERFEDKDAMGLVALLTQLDIDARRQLVEEYPERTDGASITETICKLDWCLMELVLLGLLHGPHCPEWVWARTLYEACRGGLTGLGTDEETLTSVVRLNWDHREKLSDALLQICRWKGYKKSIRELIEEELEHVHFRMIILAFLEGNT